MGDKGNAHRILVGKLEQGETLFIDGIIWKWILNKYDIKGRNGLIWLRGGKSEWL
jgi:hypothetical protein